MNTEIKLVPELPKKTLLFKLNNNTIRLIKIMDIYKKF